MSEARNDLDALARTLFRRTAQGNARLIAGDAAGYAAEVPHAADYVLFSPFGGAPTRGFDASPERLTAMKKFFGGGTMTAELIQAYAAPDMVVLAMVERHRARIGDLPEQDWALRVTETWRRDTEGWCLVHRHADPLGPGLSVSQAASLARG